MVNHCCIDMNNNVYCVDDPSLTPQNIGNIIYYSSRFREYGIPINNSASYLLINYCPWCGCKLPTSKRDEWFDALENLGYITPLSQDIPLEFRSSAWYAQKE